MDRGGDFLRAGWCETDITPSEKVYIGGQLFARVSEGVMDPVTATALALESVRGGRPGGHAVMVGCDLVAVSDELRDSVRGYCSGEPGLDPDNIILSATHTHAAPYIRLGLEQFKDKNTSFSARHPYGIELDALPPAEYMDFAAGKIAETVRRAWKGRAVSGIGYGTGHAVVGRNRRLSYRGGESRMYGSASDPDFRNVEGYEDHSVCVMAVYDEKDSLKGLVVNVPCPAQVSSQSFEISADYWHEAREEIRERVGKDVFVLPQCAPAGDQSPRVLVGARAEQRMWRLRGRDPAQNAPRQEIAEKIAGAVCEVLPCAEKEIDRNPAFGLRREMVKLARRKITEADVSEANLQAEERLGKFRKLAEEIEKNPGIKNSPRWYKPVTGEYAWMKWFQRVERRFHLQKSSPCVSSELSAVLLGEVAFAMNPFELYLDYADRIRERSSAVQTFLVQLAGPGGYIPSARSAGLGGYGSVPASTEVGPEGGEMLVDWTVGAVNSMRGGIESTNMGGRR